MRTCLPPHRLQPVKDTRDKQSALWGDLILSFCKHHKASPGIEAAASLSSSGASCCMRPWDPSMSLISLLTSLFLAQRQVFVINVEEEGSFVLFNNTSINRECQAP